MAVRTTRVDVDTALAGTPNVRVTRVDADTALAGTPKARVTRVDVEVLIVVQAASGSQIIVVGM